MTFALSFRGRRTMVTALMVLFSLQAQAANLPDLVITSLTITPSVPVAGQNVAFTAVVKNQGKAATPANTQIPVAFYVDGIEVSWSSQHTSSLAVGASITLSADGSKTGFAGWVATAGAHTFSAKVNDSLKVTESTTTNNGFSFSLNLASGLQSLARQRGFWIGAEFGGTEFNDYSALPTQSISNQKLFAREGNLYNDSGEKFDILQPNPPTFVNGVLKPAANPETDFNLARNKTLLDFVTSNGMVVHAHTLLYHMSEPTWLTGCQTMNMNPLNCTSKYTSDELRQIMKYHIQTVMSWYKIHYPGKFISWDVANEVEYNGDSPNNHSVFEKILDPTTGKNSNTYYLQLAFQYAHEADPDALLCLDDGNNEFLDAQGARYMYDFIYKLLQYGTPISCVGFEGHEALPTWNGTKWGVLSAPTQEMWMQTLQRYAKLGLKAFISELDVPIPLLGSGALPTTVVPTTQKSQSYWPAQAAVYGNALSACLLSPNCVGLTVWGFNPIYSEYNTTQSNGISVYGLPVGYSADALIFNANNNPKPAYTAFQNSLNEALAGEKIILARSMSTRSGGSIVNTINSPYFGDYVLPGIGSLSHSITMTTAGMYDVHVMAAQATPSAGSTFQLNVDGVAVTTFNLQSVDHRDYTLPVALSAGNHTVGVSTVLANRTPIYIDRVWMQPSAEYSQYIGSNYMASSSSGVYSYDVVNNLAVINGNTTLSAPFSVPAGGSYQVTLAAYGFNVGTSNPVVTVKIDDKVVDTHKMIQNAGPMEYPTLLNLTAGNHTVALSFENYVPGLTLKVRHVQILAQPKKAITVRTLYGMTTFPANPSPILDGDVFIGKGTEWAQVNVPAAGSYQISLTGASHHIIDTKGTSAYGMANILVDGVSVGTVTLNSEAWIEQSITAHLPAGLHQIGIQNINFATTGLSGYINSRNLEIANMTLTPVN